MASRREQGERSHPDKSETAASTRHRDTVVATRLNSNPLTRDPTVVDLRVVNTGGLVDFSVSELPDRQLVLTMNAAYL